MSLTPEETGAKIIADVTRILNGNNPTPPRPACFDDAHSTLSLYAEDYLQDEWTEHDTDMFIAENDWLNSASEHDLGDLEDSAHCYIADMMTFPRDLELQSQVAQSSMTKSELKLFVELHEGIGNLCGDSQKVEYFLGTIRNANPSVYEGDMRLGYVSDVIQNFARGMTSGDVENMMMASCAGGNSFAERLAAAEVLLNINEYAAAEAVACKGCDDLVDAVNNGEVLSRSALDAMSNEASNQLSTNRSIP